LQLLEVLRTILVIQTTKETKNLVADYNEETIKIIQILSNSFNPTELLRLLDLTLKRKQEIKSSPVPQLPLELLAVEFATFNDVIVGSDKGASQQSPRVTSKHIIETKTEKKSEIKSEPITELKPEPKIETITPPPPVSSTLQTSLEQIKKEWNNVIVKLSEKSASLTFVAKMSEPKKIDSEGLYITVPYDFHREKLMEAKNRKLFEEILEETFKEKMRLVCECETKQSEPSAPVIHGVDEVELGNLAAAFGGEVVG
jgi:DNA polymerase III gamma/tau subunit